LRGEKYRFFLAGGPNLVFPGTLRGQWYSEVETDPGQQTNAIHDYIHMCNHNFITLTDTFQRWRPGESGSKKLVFFEGQVDEVVCVLIMENLVSF